MRGCCCRGRRPRRPAGFVIGVLFGGCNCCAGDRGRSPLQGVCGYTRVLPLVPGWRCRGEHCSPAVLHMGYWCRAGAQCAPLQGVCGYTWFFPFVPNTVVGDAPPRIPHGFLTFDGTSGTPSPTNSTKKRAAFAARFSRIMIGKALRGLIHAHAAHVRRTTAHWSGRFRDIGD